MTILIYPPANHSAYPYVSDQVFSADNVIYQREIKDFRVGSLSQTLRNWLCFYVNLELRDYARLIDADNRYAAYCGTA